MTVPLTDAYDDDYINWQSPDASTFMAMASAEVQKYCGWQISPSVTVTSQRLWFGGHDLIMLPSTYVTAVSSVVVDGTTQVADTDYFWDANDPFIRLAPMTWSSDRFALVTYTHGYTDTPLDVKTVIFELASTAMELPASNATQIQTMQYSFHLRREIGMELSEGQRQRLGRYRIPKFGAPTAEKF